MKSPKTTVTLEDLLRLKRAEQPTAEFWNEFDRQLRSKQLAAIIEPRPWWAPLIRVGARFTHLQLPVGAAAILAVTFVTVRQYDGAVSPSESVPSLASQQYPDEARLDVNAYPVASSHSDVAVQQAPRVDLSLVESSEETVASVVELSSEPAELASGPALELEPSPSARYIAANLAAAQEADPGLMDEVFGHSLRHVQAKLPIRDPLAQVSSPGESRRARLLATALPVSTGNNEVGNATSDRIARRLTEERLYDTISRVGVKGDRVAIKF
jgi:hypothetical protein